jgi:hypothetical protein
MSTGQKNSDNHIPNNSNKSDGKPDNRLLSQSFGYDAVSKHNYLVPSDGEIIMNNLKESRQLDIGIDRKKYSERINNMLDNLIKMTPNTPGEEFAGYLQLMLDNIEKNKYYYNKYLKYKNKYLSLKSLNQ